MSEWHPIETAPAEVPFPGVDLWMRWMVKGNVQEGRLIDCWKRNGKWVSRAHLLPEDDPERYAAAVAEDNISHWMLIPEPPDAKGKVTR